MDAPTHPIDRELSQLNFEREISVRIDLITLAPVIIKKTDLILTLPSKQLKEWPKIMISLLLNSIDLEKERQKWFGIKNLQIIQLSIGLRIRF